MIHTGRFLACVQSQTPKGTLVGSTISVFYNLLFNQDHYKPSANNSQNESYAIFFDISSVTLIIIW
jgi:hypothetical protein